MPPGTFGSAGGGFCGGGSFFDRLFGGSPEPAPRPRARVGANERGGSRRANGRRQRILGNRPQPIAAAELFLS